MPCFASRHPAVCPDATHTHTPVCSPACSGKLCRDSVQEMYERKVVAGEILIKEGDTGAAASELFVVKSGEFEVRGPQSPLAGGGRLSSGHARVAC